MMHMSDSGLIIDCAENGLEAIDKVENSGIVYDMIFMDIQMPKMDGYEATRRIRAMEDNPASKLPIIAMTANVFKSDIEKCLAAGMDAHLGKPIDIDKLLETLRKYHSPSKSRASASPEMKDIKPLKPKSTVDKEAANAKIFKFFIRDAGKTIEALKIICDKSEPLNEDDIRDYTIQVHGMRSALGNVGKPELSKIAGRLEDLGREKDIEAILKETPSFIDSLQNLVDEDKAVDSSGVEEVGDEAFDSAYFNERLIAIKSACEDYDTDSVEEILAELNEKALPKIAQGLLDSIAEHLLHSDFEEAIVEIDNFS
jgi:CheY-like chemotaxis protein/HPt (histidine-containing phosphotransfer) domain-containing protein